MFLFFPEFIFSDLEGVMNMMNLMKIKPTKKFPMYVIFSATTF